MKHAFSPENPLRLGGRGSKLALTQAKLATDAIIAAYPELGAPGAIEYTVIKTSGDVTQKQGDVPLANFGSKELWTKEVEVALRERRIDAGVHCVKDVTSFLPDEYALSAYLPREDARDSWLSNGDYTLETLPEGSVVGTSSLRRQGIIMARRPDLKIVPLRGNIDTRIEKLRNGQVAATLLAYAGLSRIGRTDEITANFFAEDMLPACGQGTLCFETLSTRDDVAAFLSAVNHVPTQLATLAERALLERLDGTCNTPIGAYAVIEGDNIWLRGLVVRPDGTGMTAGERRASNVTAADAISLGYDLADELRRAGPQDIYEAAPHHASIG